MVGDTWEVQVNSLVINFYSIKIKLLILFLPVAMLQFILIDRPSSGVYSVVHFQPRSDSKNTHETYTDQF